MIMRFHLAFFAWAMSALLAHAGTTGKISGRVVDAKTNEPLVGVSVRIEGTKMGAITNLDGDYFILNIPPGEYTVSASYVGYSKLSKSKVVVKADLTTRLDFKLQDAATQTTEVVIVAERPAIQKDLTSVQQTIDAQQIINAPVETMNQIISTLASVNPVAGEPGGYVSGAPSDGLHIRGGRENETLFMIDGVKVGDDIYGGSRYIQNTSGASIQEMKTLIGTFNAEYGGKMSGVIHVITKDGSPDEITGDLRGYTDNVGISQFDRNTFQYEATASGPVPFFNGKLTFLMNGQVRSTDGRPDLVGYDIDQWRNSNGNVPLEGGRAVPADWQDDWNAMLKLTYRATESLKFSASYYQSFIRGGSYRHDYRYLPFSLPFRETSNYGAIFKAVHTLSSSVFYEAMLSYQYTDFFFGVTRDASFREIFGPRLDRDEFFYSGARQDNNNDEQRTWQGNFNLIAQVNQVHQLKTGAEVRFLDIFRRMESAGGRIQEINGRIYENYIAFVRRKPMEFAAYIQDKMEFDELGMIMNVGVRMELWNPNMQYLQDISRPISSPLIDVTPKLRFSPRFGISYPISDRAAFHLAYGHFYQYVRYMELMSGINDRGFYGGRPNLGDPGPGISNANANPEKTITYETGVQLQLAPNWTLNVTAYYRDMSDMIGIRFVNAVPENYFYLDNVDFGNAKGVEVMLEKRMSDNWAMTLNYTWALAEISTSSPLTAQQQTQDVPFQTFRADWDIPHSFGSLLTYKAPKDFTLSFRGILRSGRPYTVLAEALNSERMSWDIQTDLRIAKKFKFDVVSPVVYLQVFNVLDRRNVRRVYALTGRWDDDGEEATSSLVDANPNRISDGRSIRLGVRMEF